MTINRLQLLIGGLFLFGLALGAQAYSEKTIGGQLTAIVVPPQPGPGQSVTIRLNSYSADLDSSEISWTLNDEPVSSGLGKKEQVFTLGSLESPEVITATVKTGANTQILKKIVFQQAQIDLLWEAQVYTPPLYRGHSLPTPGSSVKIIALPKVRTALGEEVADSELIYRWRSDLTQLNSQSGRGKNTILINGKNLYNNTRIDLSLYYAEEDVSANKMLTIQTYDPFLAFYQYKPLEGVLWNRQLSDNSNWGGEGTITIQGEPYFLPLGTAAPAFSWQVNDQAADPSVGSDNQLVIEGSSSAAGTLRVNLAVGSQGQVVTRTLSGSI